MPESASNSGVATAADAIVSESPLARFDLANRAVTAAEDARVVVHERAFLGHLNLRGDGDDPRFVAAVQGVIAVALPQTPNTASAAEGLTVCWLGPDEWLIVCPGERRAAIEAGLRSAFAGIRSAITDVSGGQTIIVLRGAAVREVLAKGCPLDLHPRAFDVGRCAQSHLAKAPILVRQVDRAPTFELIVRRSFADYLWTWLEDAGREYGLAIER